MGGILNWLHFLGVVVIVWVAVWMADIRESLVSPKIINSVFIGVPLLLFWLRYFPRITGGDFNKIDWERRGILLRLFDRLKKKRISDTVG